MQNPRAPQESLEPYYRFALLLCGRARLAEQVLASVLTELQSQEGQLRSTTGRQVWLASRLRQECRRLAPSPEEGAPLGLIRAEEGAEEAPLLPIEAYLFAQRFSRLAEPGRSALALHYLEFLSLPETLSLLDLGWDRYCEALTQARTELQAGIHEMRIPTATS